VTSQTDLPTRCILCGAGLEPVLAGLTDDRFGAPGTYDVARCTACGVEQTVPRPSPEALKALYEAHYNFGGSGTSAYARLRQGLLDSFAYRLWLALDGDVSFHTRRGGGRLLDVGCNEGRGLARFRRAGFDAEGVELNAVAAGAARARGFVVHTCALADLKADAPYDVVVIANVLEHVPDLHALLGDIARLLRPGGAVWISCPNARSAFRGLFGSAWINWHVPYHLVHFSAGPLGDLLRRAGFTAGEFRQESPALWVAQTVIGRLFARPGRPTRQLRNPLLVAPLTLGIRAILFPLLWLANRTGRGDCLVVTATRP
jgi:2-polyprenyl-3-methyl-5-hydroxy-6-metoxy-1,4-benzoquinol methylase